MSPLAGILGMLVLAALNGEGSLRGRWLWASAPWSSRAGPLGCFGVARPPALSTVWSGVTRLDPAPLEQVLQTWPAA